jgi:4-amino-4-deoxy-L-arabinose transferase-like glycosyltransferase
MTGLIVLNQSLTLPTIFGGNVLTTTTRWNPDLGERHLEGDERIYIALVEQLKHGKGYNLQGHSILQKKWITPSQYDRPLFFHPPGGIAFFWLMQTIAGGKGFALSELLSYAGFFAAVLLLGSVVAQPFDRLTAMLVAALAAAAPILLQVSARIWLDAPLLAFSTLAAAIFLKGTSTNRWSLVWAAAAILGYASWIKLTALLVIPGAVALACLLAAPGDRIRVIRQSMVFVVVAIVIQVPWELLQWHVTGTPFPVWAGKPAPELVANNSYVRYLTTGRSTWFYFETLPQVLWTLVPSLALLAYQWRDVALRKRGLALCVWILAVVAANTLLGAWGYSKLLRYVILVTPATVLLFALVVSGAARLLRQGAPRRTATVLLLALAAAGFGLEITQGLRTALQDNASQDLVVPLLGMPPPR